jgi:hypothetical protein
MLSLVVSVFFPPAFFMTMACFVGLMAMVGTTPTK